MKYEKFSQGRFCYFLDLQLHNLELPSALLSPSSYKIKKSTFKKFLIFQGMELSCTKVKKFRKWNFIALLLRNFLYFLKRKFFLYFKKWNFLIFQETQTPKNFLAFSYKKKKKFRKPKSRKNSLYFRKWFFLTFKEVTFRVRKIKKKRSKKTYLKIFQEMDFLTPNFKKSCFFRKTPQDFSSLLFQVFSIFTAVFRVFTLLISFFYVTNFAAFCQALCFYVVVPQVLQI